jgi:chaperonin GroEL
MPGKLYNDILFGNEATKELREGVRKMAQLVGTTLGAGGRNVISQRAGGQSPEVINDGVTIARNVARLQFEYQDLAAQMIKDASIRTVELAGDGTTTSMVLAGKIVELGFAEIDKGYNAMKLRQEIEEATGKVVEELLKMAKPIKSREEIIQVATVSSGSEEVAKLINEVLEKVGDDGVIAVEQDLSLNNYSYTISEGMEFDRGWLSRSFVKDEERQSVTLYNPYILIVDGSLRSISDIQQALMLVNNAPDGVRELLVIADQVTDDALQILAVNAGHAVKCAAIQSPTYGDQRHDHLQDIATATAAQLIDPTKNRMDKITIDDLGRARKVVVSKAKTQIFEGRGEPDEIAERAEFIRKQMKNAIAGYEQDKLQQRLAQLTTGMGIIRVGGTTETESRERKLRVEDAIEATKAAIAEGIVAGGGVALYNAVNVLDRDQSVGGDVVYGACIEPLSLILENSGQDIETLTTLMSKDDSNLYGQNVATGEFGNMIDLGIIDPVKVVRSALSNASAVASQLLTAGAAIVVKEEK